MKCPNCGGFNTSVVFSDEGVVLKCLYCGEIIRTIAECGKSEIKEIFVKDLEFERVEEGEKKNGN